MQKKQNKKTVNEKRSFQCVFIIASVMDKIANKNLNFYHNAIYQKNAIRPFCQTFKTSNQNSYFCDLPS